MSLHTSEAQTNTLPRPAASFVIAAALAACGEGDDNLRTNPDSPTTRAMTREDSVRLGFILVADTTWDGVIPYQP